MFEIYLKSENDLTLFIEKNIVNLKKDCEKLLRFESEKNLCVSYFCDEFSTIINTINIDLKDEFLGINDENVKVVKLSKNEFVLCFLAKKYHFFQKKVKKIVQNGNIFNFFNNGLVEIESESEVLFCESYNIEIFDADVLELKNGWVAIKLFGTNYDEKSIVINQTFASVYQFDSCVIEKTESGFKVLTNLFDIAGHGLVENFNIDENITKLDEYSVYLYGKPKREFNNNVLPLYFIECVKSKDFLEAKKCLTPELSSKVKNSQLEAYFDNFTDWFVLGNKICLLYASQKQNFFESRKFECKIENNQIVNFDIL